MGVGSTTEWVLIEGLDASAVGYRAPGRMVDPVYGELSSPLCGIVADSPGNNTVLVRAPDLNGWPVRAGDVAFISPGAPLWQITAGGKRLTR